MSNVQSSVTWAVTVVAIGGILFRPWRVAEWIWACGGAAVLVALRAVSPEAAAASIARGVDVYAFLAGILVLAEFARHERLFDYLAWRALQAAKGSQGRLFALIFAVGVLVTAFLSNDTTIVVLTPAVMAVLTRTSVDPLPYLYACAFVANAASFLLPVSNPANLVVLDGRLPALGPWVLAFGPSAIAAIALTFLTLRLVLGGSLAEPIRSTASGERVDGRLRKAFTVIGTAAALLAIGAGLGFNIGFTALALAALAAVILSLQDHQTFSDITKHFPWQVLLLVAGLFVIVGALGSTGALSSATRVFDWAVRTGAPWGILGLGGVVALACNVLNNLPVGVAAGTLLSNGASSAIAHATVAAVDLGPNLSITGSLATLLWTMMLRRDGIEVGPLAFLRLGIVVTVPALFAAMLLVR